MYYNVLGTCPSAGLLLVLPLSICFRNLFRDISVPPFQISQKLTSDEEA